MRISVLPFCLLFLSIESQSQPITFIKNYLSGELSYNNVIQTHVSGFAILCVNVSGMTLVKTDKYGDTLWTKSYGIQNPDYFRQIAEKNGGGYFIRCFDNCGGVYDCTSIMNLDSGGNFIWKQLYQLNYAFSSNKMILNSLNHIFLCGSTSYGISADFDEVVMELDSGGNVLFQKTYLKNSADDALSFRLNSNGDYYFISHSDSVASGLTNVTTVTHADNSGDVIWSTETASTEYLYTDLEISPNDEIYAIMQSEKELLVLKLDSLGNKIWAKKYFGNYYSSHG